VPVLGYFRYLEIRFGSSGPQLQGGWGHVAPKAIPIYGDGTDSFFDVHWSDWGQPVAYGFASTDAFWPRGGHVALPAEIRATRLGTCHGKLSYKHVDERLLVRPGTRRYRVFGTRNNLQWSHYGLPGYHGDICGGPHVL
jgi:hypothetical protein